MKCPMKMREHHVDGHTAECVNDCAWLVERRCKHGKTVRACAIALIAHKGCEPFRAWTNALEDE